MAALKVGGDGMKTKSELKKKKRKRTPSRGPLWIHIVALVKMEDDPTISRN